jgi:hypothetical protein
MADLRMALPPDLRAEFCDSFSRVALSKSLHALPRDAIGRRRFHGHDTNGIDVHLPDAVRSFGARKAWRFWSLTDPAVHQAMYQFDDAAALERAVGGEEMKRLIADFNRDWPDVTRTRESFVIAETFPA